MKIQTLLLLITIPILLLSSWLYINISNPQSRISNLITAFKRLYYMKDDDVKRFMKSYELFANEKVTDDTENLIIDYYNVLNSLCALGEVEKMYIPPVMDPNLGVFDNQIEYEKKIIDFIGAGPGKHILDVGCGRGGVSTHIASRSGAKLTGMNIDPAQLMVARERAQKLGISDRVNYVEASFNHPFPFPDNSFDGLYNIQALSYAKDYDSLFREMFRVLKPGARLSFLDWFTYQYDESNEYHRDLMRKVKPMIGAVFNPTPKVMAEALERAGFKVEVNENASIDGHQYTLIESADFYFTSLHAVVRVLVKIGVLPQHFLTLFDRLTQDADSFITGDKLKLWTSCHQVVAVKPLQ